ncbi:MAG TPA: PQQ-binding-like beta-propeller repeat protein [Terriglobales bacterium]|nr:PQQ-binding-like beta-propeller repeat protein [Terriglobales bacterium]
MNTSRKRSFTFTAVTAVAACAGMLMTIPPLALGQAHTQWSDYGGDPDAAQYTALQQINRRNVGGLQVAWTLPTGDGAAYSFEPVQAHGVLYLMTAAHAITAVNAATGKLIWTYTPAGATKIMTDRGMNYWESADGKDRRLVFARNQLLQELDARTGKPITSFGNHGTIDLRDGLGRDPSTLTVVETATPGRVFGNLLIEGSATNQGWGSAPGDIRAFNIPTGRLVWTFHTIPHPGELGYNTWPKDAWKTVGGANSWGEISVDAQRGIVYIPTASPKFNFYGGDRAGADLFGDCLLALDARTGKLLWYFQMVHHDIWDYDNTSAPKLLTVMHDGKPEDVVAEAGKTGWVYVFDRVTGKPLWPIVERPEPKSDVPGEQTYPTQPIPTTPPPFARQKFTSADLNPYLPPAEAAQWKQEIDQSRNGGMFTPPALSDVMEMPGNAGGANWGASAADAKRGIFMVVSMDFPTILKLDQPATTDVKTGLTKYNMKGFGYMRTSLGVPPISPPWSTITAYDLNKGTILWQSPLGDLPVLAAKGIHDTGSSQPKTGPVITASGLVFTATRDHYVRAYDETTGKVLWAKSLDAPLQGVPVIYEAGGREYLVVCAAAPEVTSARGRTPIHGAYVAFALPQ